MLYINFYDSSMIYIYAFYQKRLTFECVCVSVSVTVCVFNGLTGCAALAVAELFTRGVLDTETAG